MSVRMSNFASTCVKTSGQACTPQIISMLQQGVTGCEGQSVCLDSSTRRPDGDDLSAPADCILRASGMDACRVCRCVLSKCPEDAAFLILSSETRLRVAEQVLRCTVTWEHVSTCRGRSTVGMPPAQPCSAVISLSWNAIARATSPACTVAEHNMNHATRTTYSMSHC